MNYDADLLYLDGLEHIDARIAEVALQSAVALSALRKRKTRDGNKRTAVWGRFGFGVVK